MKKENKEQNNKSLNKSEEVDILDSKQSKKKKRIISNELKNALKFPKSYNALLKKVDDDILVLKLFKKELKKINDDYDNDIDKVNNSKRQINTTGKYGFMAEVKLPNDLADLIKVERGTKMSRTEYTSKLYDELKIRNLACENNKRIFRADEEMKRVFHLSEEVNNSLSDKDKNGFNYKTIQTHLANAFKQTDSIQFN
jgi:chromatin remodeling complex protein RSC6